MLMTAKGGPLARGEAGRHIGKGAEIQAAGGTTAGGTKGGEGGGRGTEKGTTGEGGDQGNKEYICSHHKCNTLWVQLY